MRTLETRERRCGLCNQPGHTRASMRCTVNIRRLQAEFAPHGPLESTSNPELASQVIPRATVQAILDSASRSTSQSAL